MSKIWTFPLFLVLVKKDYYIRKTYYYKKDIQNHQETQKKCQTDQNIHFMFFKGALMTDLHTIGIQPASWDTIATHFK